MENGRKRSPLDPIPCALDEHICGEIIGCVVNPRNPRCIKKTVEWAEAIKSFIAKGGRPRSPKGRAEVRNLMADIEELGVDPKVFKERIEDILNNSEDK